ncbi:WXG100 family type VII secretion target [Nocardioides sp.]|uniref:WXG100 family type VII secretion target n=1 Tax=Nocardioides sp. TaxID=35761 RepID=UPI002733B215|nr:WXG100 family type VII secretion target [Nocardioides sp.]MDP3889650.1 WXG100 family type VII secretion target [Nocardioides sp.]
MAGFQGMDPVVLRGIAERMRTQAVQLDDVLSTVQRTVDEAISLWDGDDAHGFNGWWTSHYRPALSAAHHSLVDAAAAIERNVHEQERASGAGGTGGATGIGSGGSPNPGGRPGTSANDMLGPLWPFDVVGIGGDIAETWFGKGLDDLPGGGFLGPLVKGVGVGTSGASMIDALQQGDYAGAAGYGVDTISSAFAKSPVGLLWTGLSEEVFFFIPRDASQQDAHLQYMQQVRGMTSEQISERYTGFQGFIDLGNDNAARKAPWLVEGADRLMEKPAEWLYNVGIRL